MIIGLRRGIDPPINPSYAYSPELIVTRPLIGYLSTVHSIDYWVAGLLIRPMLADLTEAGSWRRDTAQRFVLQDGLCHCFVLERTLRHVAFYLADHSQYNCFAAPSPPPPANQSTWFCAPDNPVPPPEGSHNAWRYLLRTAVDLPVRVSHVAFHYFARLDPGSGLGPPDRFLSTFEALAEQARIVHTLLPEGPGMFNIVVGTQVWTVLREDALDPRRKPRVHSIQHFRDPAAPPQTDNAHPVPLPGETAPGRKEIASGEFVAASTLVAAAPALPTTVRRPPREP
ncbi:hypothetical protein ACFFS2_30365 [Streptomyces aurantiacus]|uniref:Uncharacterized protein n=1 Tax=Streptomyces aurantiacus TaxID=47760 RepID=A0A7G1P0T8_9ACTN|nr:hypothetical protein [Streptomyces aurantiacus]BCL28592.1 hypothetical protein GCM10017557_34510 [Streptomyces aurantiacus]